MQLIDKILVPGVSRRGDIVKKGDQLEKGYKLGRKLAKYDR